VRFFSPESAVAAAAAAAHAAAAVVVSAKKFNKNLICYKMTMRVYGVKP